MPRNAALTPKQRFLTALGGQPTDRPAVGNPTSIVTTDLMDYTGCYFPSVHNDAEQMARLAAAGHELLGYDTVAPYFSVIQEAAAFGAEIDWGGPDRMPAVRPFNGRNYLFQDPDQIRVPPDFLDRQPVRTVLEAIRLLRRRFSGRVAILGKAIGPWTLAYHLFGLENFLVLVIDAPARLQAILERLMRVTVLFGRAQIEAGADCLVLPDHLTGDLCRADTYRDFLLPIHQRLRAELPGPIILHICGYTLDRLDHICRTGFDAFHFDSKNDARQAVQLAAGRLALVGNINNPECLVGGDEQQIVSQVHYALDAGVAVIGPECAVPLNARWPSLKLIADAAQSWPGRRR